MTPFLYGAALRLRSFARRRWLRPTGWLRRRGRNSLPFRGRLRRQLATLLLLLGLRLLLLLRLPLLSRLL
jgi:hypothetical protein